MISGEIIFLGADHLDTDAIYPGKSTSRPMSPKSISSTVSLPVKQRPRVFP